MLVVTLLGSFWPTFVELHHRWSDFDGSYSYGYLVPLMAAYMCVVAPACSPPWQPVLVSRRTLTRLGQLGCRRRSR